jgi:hypothetical protein
MMWQPCLFWELVYADWEVWASPVELQVGAHSCLCRSSLASASQTLLSTRFRTETYEDHPTR